MSSRRSPRGPGGGPRGPFNPSPAGNDDSPAMTNLGALLQQAMAAQQTTQQTAEAPEREPEAEAEAEAVVPLGVKPCADCWNALTFKDAGGRQMARCAKDLWVKASVTVEELNGHRVRRWYADCPEYDDSE